MLGIRLQTIIPAALLFATINVTAQEVRFNRDIRPIFTENCFHCHGPDPGTRKAGLRFDRRESLLGKTKDGTAVVVIPGKPSESELYKRIMTADADDVMPPGDSHKELTAVQKDLVKRWIEQGAPWEAHWSFITPQKAALPAVKDAKWVRNPIDAFVLAKLEANGLAPAPEADRRASIRRVSLDLTGLLPEPVDVETFVADTAANAYEKVVDKYLASPHYGEHRARYWLDAARYADTHGLHFDNYREIWPYRDWVISAFNQNEPFDQFTTDQLAGDLIPDHTLDQQVASGFMRCGMTTNEGGTIAEENLVFYAQDRTETAARVWLGLTMNCCVCHDHKFDPVAQKDFYSMSAFFNNITMSALDGNVKDTAPSITVPKAEDRAAFAKLLEQANVQKAQLAQRREAAKAEFDGWASGVGVAVEVKALTPKKELQFAAALSEGSGTVIHAKTNGVAEDIALEPSATWKPGYVASKALVTDKAAAADLPAAGDFERDKPYTVAIWAKLPKRGTSGSVVARMNDDDNFRGWDIWIEGDRLATHIINQWPANAIKVVSNDPIDARLWHHIAVTYDGSSKAAGVKLYVDGRAMPSGPAADSLTATIRTKVPMRIGSRAKSSLISGLLTQDLRIYNRALPPAEVQQLRTTTRLTGLLARAAKRTPAEQKELYELWLTSLDQSSVAAVGKISDLDSQMAVLQARGASTLVMQEKPTPAVAYVLYRGAYDQRRDQVSPATPGSLPPMAKDSPDNRLGFAEWLFRADHPLTSRVTVNRWWQDIFGAGIVRTADDFGVMGEVPSNPELLDWLAVDFRENHWDVKRLMKEIVMSSTYRQSATASPAALAKDPDNRLISRGPRFRMDGEMVRDTALVASELYVPNIGGPSVRPYQPEGLWEVVGMPGSTTRDYKQDHGESLYRRSMYTFWKRAAPPASLEIFNAPSREGCTVKRERTDTPMQALVTLNDTQFMEAARALSQRALEQNGAFDAKLNFLTERLVARPFKPAEVSVCKSTLDDLLAYYQGHTDDAKKLLAVGESKRDEAIDPATHAAWTMLTNQLMNLDETLNK